MPVIVTSIVFFLLCLPSTSLWAQSLSSPSDCKDTDTPLIQPEAEHALSLPIKLVNWNIQKANNAGWQTDLDRYISNTSLVLLQEATDDKAIFETLKLLKYASLAPGYHSGSKQTGVMTASHTKALRHCFMLSHEPWLRTPKAVQLSWYALKENSQPLLVINIHSINFAFGLKDYQAQVQAFMAIAKQHQGPMIVSGDFNTWKDSRKRRLDTAANKLGLSEVPFNGNLRKKFLSNALDHVYVRGLDVTHSYAVATESSDHNPLFVELTLAQSRLPAVFNVAQLNSPFED